MAVLSATIGIWFVITVLLSVVNPPPAASPPFRLAIVLIPILTLLLSLAFFPRFRRLMARFPTWALMAAHIIRLPVGAAFLILAGKGLLPHDFSTPAGMGDMLAGGTALALMLWFRKSAMPAWLLVAWNVLGLLDFLNVQRVVATLGRAGRGAEFIAMQGPPLALVPYFGVPLLFFLHLYMLGNRIRAENAPPPHFNAKPSQKMAAHPK